MGSPWGPPPQFQWRSTDKDLVPEEVKSKIHDLLVEYAMSHSVRLLDNGLVGCPYAVGSVRMAVQVDSRLWADPAETPYWVSYGGGISSFPAGTPCWVSYGGGIY